MIQIETKKVKKEEIKLKSCKDLDLFLTFIAKTAINHAERKVHSSL